MIHQKIGCPTLDASSASRVEEHNPKPEHVHGKH